MGRPTIKDLAIEAGVSVATVNRVLAGNGGVRSPTMERVREAAEAIGFYGTGAIRSRIIAARPKMKFGFLLHQPGREFYQNIAKSLRKAAEAMVDCEVTVRIEFLEDLTPQNTANRMLALAESCDALGVVAAVHPILSQAIDQLLQRGLPVFGLVSQLSATGQVPYIGTDNWKAGRLAGWTIQNFCKSPGKIGILVGNHRYRCQEMNEAGFRSYFREFAPEFSLLEPLSTFESSVVAQEMTEKLLRDVPDIAGLFVAGGGITGVLTALRQNVEPGRIVVVGHQLLEVTRQALLDNYLTLLISYGLEDFAARIMAGMIQAVRNPDYGNLTNIMPFEIYTRENI
jgi:LacI family transcriptional regulator